MLHEYGVGTEYLVTYVSALQLYIWRKGKRRKLMLSTFIPSGPNLFRLRNLLCWITHILESSRIWSSNMAGPGSSPFLPRSSRPDFSIPMPPPPLHTRSGNEYFDSPRTPTQGGFTSPSSTPQGSPSKNKVPPGAHDLPSVFENAMKLGPSTPTKGGRAWLRGHSPNKASKQAVEEDFEDSTIYQGYNSGSPTRKSNKENTTPGIRPPKETNYAITHAAKSRQEPYQYRETAEPITQGRYNVQRGLTPEEVEKLQLPKVKRLANVTQLCEAFDLISVHQELMRY